MAFVLTTRGEVNDLLSSMILWMPDEVLPNTNLGLDGAYQRLEDSLGAIHSKIGDERYTQLIDMARRSKQHFVDDERKAGLFMLQDMKKLLNKRE